MKTLIKLLALSFILPVDQAVSSPYQDRHYQVRETVSRFLKWEEKVRPSGIYSDRLRGELHELISPQLLCLLNAASDAREHSTLEAPDEKPLFVEGNPFLPDAFERPESSTIITSQHDEVSEDFLVRVRFNYEQEGAFISTFRVRYIEEEARIVDIDAGGLCDFCQSGSFITYLQQSLHAYSPETQHQCGPTVK
ncbi:MULTISPECIES: hypothetical protein [Enterobacteriaceae]|uniref:DUF3828 domain-containing protein n=1 Tax=Lelliottia amnigena TaxID=61646 RepID=A0ABU7UGS1_LELAM|nr:MULTISPECIES: hypothetical protein [Enterobacter]OXL38529.1 hypothetical protein CA284_18675 [Enterobacter mori]CAH8250004.1 Uncharacterised protein [Enterobacter ludwigii]